MIYRFTSDGTGHVNLSFKYWTTDEQWKPLPGQERLEIFRCHPGTQRQMLPEGLPDLVPALFDLKTDFVELSKSIQKIQDMIPPNEHAWWLNWLNQDEDEADEGKYNTRKMWDDMADTWPFPLSVFEPYAEPYIADPDDITNADAANLNPIRSLRKNELASPEIKTHTRNQQHMAAAISTAVGKMAIYITNRSEDKLIGKIVSTQQNDKAKLLRYEEGKKKWSSSGKFNVVPANNIIKLFDLNKNGALPKRIQERMQEMQQEESDNQNSSESECE